mmetsp:Transcript_10952/g.11376  ORF Transcript_10952/g.11376 Transcript_10952/m.11376 type:complete len:137 (+) Transcript_10952:217-627(+)
MEICEGSDLSDRRRLLMQNADIILTLPGGPGTFDELWEASVCKLLSLNGLQYKPLCVLNVDNYFDGTILQLQRAHEDNLLYASPESYFHVETDVNAAFQWCLEEYERLKLLKQSDSQPNTDSWQNAEGGKAPIKFH